eukprot:TRINITY_DN7737_c0_g1_i1.p1 TRINITY_DN7737_c0_g1~~TRINITY_DN7737_c0_g1_i1.p1  ORF type:complete len:189 (-),score=1.03 TRINITY_DN7737_c0_g1_i1:37-603(-)
MLTSMNSLRSLSSENPLLSFRRRNTRMHLAKVFNTLKSATSKNLEDATYASFLHHQILLVEISIGMLAGVILGVSYFHSLIEFKANHSKEFELSLLAIISVTNIFLLLVTPFRYRLKVNFLKTRGVLTSFDDVYSAGYLRSIVMELFILFPHPNPFLINCSFNVSNSNFEGTFSYTCLLYTSPSPRDS